MGKLFISVVMGLVGLSLQAATAPSAKICVVDFERAIKEEKLAAEKMRLLETAEKALVEEQQAAQTAMEKKLQDHQKAKDTLQSAKDALHVKIMSGKESKATIEKEAKALDEKAGKIANQEENLKTEIGNLQKKFAEKQQTHEANIQREKGELELKNKLLIESVAAEEGCLVAMPSQAVLFGGVDITPQVFTKFNNAYPSKPAVPQKGGKPSGPGKK